jgi:predicted NBD/HSP70 family sugar kinase
MPGLSEDFDLYATLRDELRRSGLPFDSLTLINEASAATLGTAVDIRMQGVPGPRDFVLLRLADVVGGGVVSGHRLVTGSAGQGPEIGHLTVRSDGVLCRRCGARGCLETVASTPALSRELSVALGEREAPASDPTPAPTLMSKFAGDSAPHPAYAEAMREAGWWTGVALSQVVNLFNPQLIVLADPNRGDRAGAPPAPIDDRQFQHGVETSLRQNSLGPAYSHLMGGSGEHGVFGVQFGDRSKREHGLAVTDERGDMLRMVGAAADLVYAFGDDAFARRLSGAHEFTPRR